MSIGGRSSAPHVTCARRAAAIAAFLLVCAAATAQAQRAGGGAAGGPPSGPPAASVQGAGAPAAVGGGTAAESNDVRARRLFEIGRTAYDNALYEDALRYFRESYALSGRPALLYNIGQCADRLRRDDDAIDAFERYLAAQPTAANRAEVETRLEVLRRARAERRALEAAHPTEPASGDGARDTAAQAQEGARAQDGDEGGLLTRWWFWAIVGAVVAGAAVGFAVAAAPGEPALPAGDFGPGGVVVTLRGPE